MAGPMVVRIGTVIDPGLIWCTELAPNRSKMECILRLEDTLNKAYNKKEGEPEKLLPEGAIQAKDLIVGCLVSDGRTIPTAILPLYLLPKRDDRSSLISQSLGCRPFIVSKPPLVPRASN